MEHRWSNIDKLSFAFYGGIYAIGIDFLIYPLEVIKTNLQVQRKGKAAALKDTMSSVRAIVRQQGIRGLYKAFTWFSFGGLPVQGFYYFTYNFANDQLCHNEMYKLPTEAAAFSAGVLADVACSALWMPAEVIIKRLQIQEQGVDKVQRVAYSGFVPAFRQILREEGIRGLYRGYGALIASHAPASGLWWLTYEAVKNSVSASSLYTHPNPAEDFRLHMGAGFCAGVTAAGLTTPMDLAKTRMMTQHAIVGPGRVMHRNFVDALVWVVRHEGVLALTRGILPRVMVAGPSSALTFVAYEHARSLATITH